MTFIIASKNNVLPLLKFKKDKEWEKLEQLIEFSSINLAILQHQYPRFVKKSYNALIVNP